MASGPDAEVEEQVLVELLQQGAVALSQDLIQQPLTRHQDIHVHHAAGNLQPEDDHSHVTPSGAPLVLCVSVPRSILGHTCDEESMTYFNGMILFATIPRTHTRGERVFPLLFPLPPQLLAKPGNPDVTVWT